MAVFRLRCPRNPVTFSRVSLARQRLRPLALKLLGTIMDLVRLLSLKNKLINKTVQ